MARVIVECRCLPRARTWFPRQPRLPRRPRQPNSMPAIVQAEWRSRTRGVPANSAPPRLGVGAGVRSKSQPQPIARLGRTTHSGGGLSFGIKPADRRHHVYVVGKTGSGKTTLLKNLAIQDIRNGHGLAVIDPHGDLAESLLDHIPASTTSSTSTPPTSHGRSGSIC